MSSPLLNHLSRQLRDQNLNVYFAEQDDERVREAASKIEALGINICREGEGIEQACALLKSGRVHVAIAGAKLTTAEVARAAIKNLGAKQLTSAFVMERRDELYVFADAGIIVEPNQEQLVNIANAAAELFRVISLSAVPRVAFLSFSTKGSARHPRAAKMSEAAAMFAEQAPNILSDGELQVDAALIPEVANRKCPSSNVEGRANIFVFPSLESANISYKFVQRLGSFAAYGPLLLGCPYFLCDLSRGAAVEDIVGTTLITLARYKGAVSTKTIV